MRLIPDNLPELPITNCPDGSGSYYNKDNENGGIPATPTSPDNTTKPTDPYKVPDYLCFGDYDNNKTGDDKYQEKIAAENLNVSGAPLNVFKLLGLHEQGKLVDLVGLGKPLNKSANVFDAGGDSWKSAETGLSVLTSPSWIGYDFGTIKTSYNAEAYAPSQPILQHITSFRITQPTALKRALQVRVDSSNGNFSIPSSNIIFTGVGNGLLSEFTQGLTPKLGTFMLTATSSTTFSVFFMGDAVEVLGICTVNKRFVCNYGSFIIKSGSTPFAINDTFSAKVQMDWYRVDVVNIQDTADPVMVRIKQSAGARYWRILPTSFSGVSNNNEWEVSKLELFDYGALRLEDIQDHLYMENRDRDYANQAIQIKVSYQPFDAISDLSKFGFQIADTYAFSTTFATMVSALGRPIIVGDVLELPSEIQYDTNLRPIRKFLEVTDCSWAADGFTSTWRPIIWKFQASQLIPSQEHRDILGTLDTAKYTIDNEDFFSGMQQVQTELLTAQEINTADARMQVPEKGSDAREFVSGTNRFNEVNSTDNNDLYVEDGLPPNGLPYTEGFKLPDVASQQDGNYFRLNYDPKLNIASRLYKFSSTKNAWVYMETDRRNVNSSHRPSHLEIFNQPLVKNIGTKTI